MDTGHTAPERPTLLNMAFTVVGYHTHMDSQGNWPAPKVFDFVLIIFMMVHINSMEDEFARLIHFVRIFESLDFPTGIECFLLL